MTASFPLEVIDLWNLVHSYFVLNSQKSRDDVNNALVLPSATKYITYLYIGTYLALKCVECILVRFQDLPFQIR